MVRRVVGSMRERAKPFQHRAEFAADLDAFLAGG
jgi:hypothetical protein